MRSMSHPRRAPAGAAHGSSSSASGARRAVRTGASWVKGRLAGRTLRDALEAAGLDPAAHIYLNAYRDPEPVDDRAPRIPDDAALARAARLAAAGPGSSASAGPPRPRCGGPESAISS
jgi:hypothetical protein